jgi:hypothetical protein
MYSNVDMEELKACNCYIVPSLSSERSEHGEG